VEEPIKHNIRALPNEVEFEGRKIKKPPDKSKKPTKKLKAKNPDNRRGGING
jgi:hypothetical protein